MANDQPETVLILDFGSQYAQLIARRVRENRVYSEIVPHDISAAEIRERQPVGCIISGGPASVYVEGAPACDPEIFDLDVPILGICYGMQLMMQALGGDVKTASEHEYGRTRIEVDAQSRLFTGVPAETTVWMSHGDRVVAIPDSFQSVGRTASCPYAAVIHDERPLVGLQFHPEVTHTPEGERIIGNFLFEICNAAGNWEVHSFIEKTVADIREQVGDARVLCALSGGVDSSVVALLLQRAIGSKLTCVFVDNGLLRAGEAEEVQSVFGHHFQMDFRSVEAQDRFLSALADVTDPEEKRRIVGHTFIDVFTEEARDLEDVRFLAQGTLYPDVIESRSPRGGPSVTIKTHHNVGGLPENLGLELVEPLRLLFKDEVRRIGAELGLPHAICYRHPFPGPGLSVRILGDVTPERVRTLQRADAIVIEEFRAAGWYEKVWQAFAVFLPVRTVGVMGDSRTYENAVAIRVVESEDGMTADWSRVPQELLATISSRIINEVPGLNRVVYDITSKPPGTIEWE